MTTTKKLVFLSLLTSLALVIYTLELQLPAITAIPGIKMGLANMVSLATLLLFGPKEALSVLILRILLGSLLTGQVSSMFFSLSGGLLSNIGMIMIYFLTRKKIPLWLLSMYGAILHSIGQLLIAFIIVRTPGLILYLPILLFSSLITGYFIGLGTHFIVKHFRMVLPSISNGSHTNESNK